MQNVRIRPMIDSDVECKGYVHLKSCLETYEGLMDPEVVAGWTLEVYQAIARRFVANTIVAELDSKIVGFGCWDPAGGISALYVLQVAQGYGIGRMLMDALLEQLAGCGQVRLQVLESNDKAIGFYEHLGFRLTGESEITKYSSQHPALWMARTV